MIGEGIEFDNKIKGFSTLNSHFFNNSAKGGAGLIKITDSSVKVYDTLFSNNHAIYGRGGSIFIKQN